MKWLVLDGDYTEFVRSLYQEHPRLEEGSYAAQMAVRSESLFGIADVYAKHLRKAGHEAQVSYISSEILQTTWAREHDLPIQKPGPFPLFSRPGPGAWRSRFKFKGWKYDVLAAQIREEQPDIILNLAMPDVRPEFLAEVKSHTRCLVGQHAATTLNPKRDWSVYDLVLSSFPPTVDWCRRQGLSAEFLRLAFEPSVLEQIPACPRTIPISFIGSFSDVHTSRTALLQTLAQQVDLQIWGPAPSHGFTDEHLQQAYRGQAWGRKMFEVLASSRLTINHHGDVPAFANNMRLYEATGLGTLLITDPKPNLPDLFEPDAEVITYRDVDECVAKTRFYLAHEDKRQTIADAGQRRTLREHTYAQRTQELVEMVGKRL